MNIADITSRVKKRPSLRSINTCVDTRWIIPAVLYASYFNFLTNILHCPIPTKRYSIPHQVRRQLNVHGYRIFTHALDRTLLAWWKCAHAHSILNGDMSCLVDQPVSSSSPRSVNLKKIELTSLLSYASKFPQFIDYLVPPWLPFANA